MADDDTLDSEWRSGPDPDDAGRDSVRISAELADADHGTDPFAAAVRAMRPGTTRSEEVLLF